MAVGDRYIPMSFYESLADARRTLRENSLLALEMQTDFLHWMGSEHSKGAYRDFMKCYGHRKVVGTASQDQQAEWLRQRVKGVFAEASTYFVSDDMCQPSDTQVMTVTRSGNSAGAATWVERPISEIRPGDRVVSWKRRRYHTLRLNGRPVTAVRSRQYDGPLIQVATEDGSVSRYTPEHPCIAWLDGSLSDGNHIVYLMRRGGDFRVGRTQWMSTAKTPRHGWFLRAQLQGADAVWILSVHTTDYEAALEEAVVQNVHNLPGQQFYEPRPLMRLEDFWAKVGGNQAKAVACLTTYGRDIAYPFWTAGQSLRGPQVLQACNLMSGMRVCVAANATAGPHGQRFTPQASWVPATVSGDGWYSGLVYSLEVEADHTYIADGILTHNCEMIKMAAEAMPSEGLHESDLPSKSGFLLFARPVFIEGPDGSPDDAPGTISGTEGDIPVSAIAWIKGDVRRADDSGLSPGISYFLFMSPHDVAAVSNQSSLQEAIALMATTGVPMPEPHYLADGMTEQDAREKVGPLPIYDFSGWTFGQAWNRVPWGNPDSIGLNDDGDIHAVYPVVDQARRLMLATWKMLNERITVVDSERPPRPMIRRASRVMPNVGDVLVIRLRKESHPGRLSGDDTPVEQWWSHRWLVRGFWRRPPGSAPDARQTIWVNPYIKGPADKPLIVKDKIYSLEQ